MNTTKHYSHFPVTITLTSVGYVDVIDRDRTHKNIDTGYLGWMNHSPFETVLRAAIRKFIDSNPEIGTSTNYMLHIAGFLDWSVEVVA